MKYLLLLILLSSALHAQGYRLSGTVLDAATNTPLPDADIVLSPGVRGSATDSLGAFTIHSIPAGDYTLTVSFAGYSTQSFALHLDGDKHIRIALEPLVYALPRTIINGRRARFRETPVAFTNVDDHQIQSALGSRYITSILDNAPGLYISDEGGGYADSRISIRGYDQTHISVQINGIPVNNPENGEIYWSNWADLSDVVQSIQVQRGLSATPFSVTSIGGVANIVTRNAFSGKPFYKLTLQTGSDNFRKATASFHLPLAQNKIYLLGMISRAKWDGYADRTQTDLYTFFLSLGMILKNHTLELQFMGAPQKHGQRVTPLHIRDWQKYGWRHNADWGYLHGKPLSSRDNHFFKPSLTLNHFWRINEHAHLSNVLYLSHGKGGGTVPPWYGLGRDTNGLIDFDSVWETNSRNIDTTYSDHLNRSLTALRFTYHIHDWAVARSSLEYSRNGLTYYLGVDGTLYKAQNYSTLSHLLGGDYYIDFSNANRPPDQMLQVGDIVDYNAESFVRAYGAYGQMEYKTDIFSAYLNSSFATTSYDRINHFYTKDNPNRETGWKTFTAFTLKGGINYNPTDWQNIYFNIGKFQKAPLAMNVYTYSNTLYDKVKNEDIFSTEIGYGWQSDLFRFNVNLYYTLWKDRVLNYTALLPEPFTRYFANIYGARSLHKGLEADIRYALTPRLTVNGFLTVASNVWLNDVTSYLMPEGYAGQPLVFNTRIKGLYEGNAPMNKFGLGITYRHPITPATAFSIKSDYIYYGRFYAQFDPAYRSQTDPFPLQSWRIPDYNVLNMHSGLSWRAPVSYIHELEWHIDVFNVLNSHNIIQAIDGIRHDRDTAFVWYNRERWFNTTLRLTF